MLRGASRVAWVSRWFVVVGLVVALGLAARVAEACTCGWDGAIMWAPHFVGLVPLDLRGEEVKLRCDRDSARFIVCRFIATYRLYNPGGARALSLEIAHPGGAAVVLSLNGVVVANRPAPARSEQRRAALGRDGETTVAPWLARAGEEVTLTVDATFLVAPAQCFCFRPTIGRRHPVVTSTPGGLYDIEYRYHPQRNFGSEPPTYELAVEHPRRIQSNFPEPSTPRVKDEGEYSNPQGWGGSFYRWRLNAGGPIAAAGVGWSPEGRRPRVRVGWELAWPHMLVHSLVVETDTKRRVAVVPAWELALPSLRFSWPDLGIGVGVPIQVVPVARTGVRLHWRFGYWIFHVLGTFDHFPGGRGLPQERLGSLMFQVGF